MQLSVAAAALAAAAGGAYAYASQWPASELFGETLIAGNDPAQLALTFDDGPNGDTTLRLLDQLAQAPVRATFFLIGSYVRAQPEIARRVAAVGHLIGNHTQSHPALASVGTARTRRELADCNAALEDVIGQRVRYMRPPFGSRRPSTLRIAREMGLTPVMWNCSGKDWELTSGEQIAARLLSGVRKQQRAGRGSNLLMHDGSHRGLGADRNATLDAVQRILAISPAAQFVTVDAFAQGDKA